MAILCCVAKKAASAAQSLISHFSLLIIVQKDWVYFLIKRMSIRIFVVEDWS
jgi:hypothetical protein